MTSEEQLRAALLGGRQLSMLASSRQSTAHLDRQELSWISSLHSQGAVLRVLESAPDIWRLASIVQKATPEAERIHRAIGHIYMVESGALLRSSEDTQWRSLRNNVFHRLESIYTFRERANVVSFLERNFFLTPLLLQANDKIREFFGLSAVALEVSTDPDDSSFQELWARIQTSKAPEEALSILTRFDEEWWLDASASSQNLLNIKLEYV